MSQVCSKCTHANPPDAIYCYFDGAVLGGHAANGRTFQAGSQPFPSQFVFPVRQSRAAISISSPSPANKTGQPRSIFSSKASSPASSAASAAPTSPWPPRRLPAFPTATAASTSSWPSSPHRSLKLPKLRAEPTEVSLGVINSAPIAVSNCTSPIWECGSCTARSAPIANGSRSATLPAIAQKLFQFGGEAVVHVQVRGQYLRAGNKLAGRPSAGRFQRRHHDGHRAGRGAAQALSQRRSGRAL